MAELSLRTVPMLACEELMHAVASTWCLSVARLVLLVEQIPELHSAYWQALGAANV
jgi:hypothetical protein